VQDGDEEQAVKLVEEALENRIPAIAILNKGLVPGVQALGKLFKEGQLVTQGTLLRPSPMGLNLLPAPLKESRVQSFYG
jgi:methanogenic corrinoid protein MtbC1